MLNILIRSKQTYLILFLYLIVVGWWISLTRGQQENPYLFNWSYGLIGLSSSVYAWYIAKTQWGGLKSAMGRLIIFLGIGLFAQWVGLQIWTYYNLNGIEVPYPSLADIGYFGLVPAYLYAAFMLAKVTGVRFSLRTVKGKAIAWLLPIVSLSFAYGLFLKNIGFDTSEPIRLFFDIAYPLGEILPATVALVILFGVSENIGGKMRSRILWLIGAFVFQFLTEYLFLYQSATETYVNGGIVDFLYATSYMIMGLGIVGFSKIEAVKAERTVSQEGAIR